MRHERLFTGSLLLGISAVIALMIASIFVTRKTSDEQRDATARVLHALDILGHVDEIHALITESEAAQRGFILSNDADYLEPFATAARAIESRIDDLERLTTDNPPQLARTQRLRGLIRDGLRVTKGMKIGDIDTRDDVRACYWVKAPPKWKTS